MRENDWMHEGTQPAQTPDTERLLKFLSEQAEANRAALRDDANSNRKAFLGTLKIVAYPLAVVLTFAGILGFKSVNDLMKSIREEGQRESKAEIARMQGEIRKTLNAQFEVPTIRAMVKDAAREYTGTTAAPLVKSEVTREVQARVRAAEPQIRTAVISESRKTITEETRRGVAEMQPKIEAAVTEQTKAAEARIQAQIAPYSEIIKADILAALARSGDGTAFDNLMTRPASPDPQIRQLVSTTRETVYMQFAEAVNETGYLRQQFTNPYSKDELLFILARGDVMTRKGAVDGLTLLHEKAMVPTFIGMLRTDPSILVRQAAYHGLIQLTSQKMNPLDKPGWDDWGEKNKSNWPPK